jgi:hypothetical protein
MTTPDYGTTMLSANPPRQPDPISAGRVFGWFLFVNSILWPRIVILAFWLFGGVLASSASLGDAFDGWVLPVLGFFVLPWTTMWYALMWGLSSDAVTGAEWIVVGVGMLLDIATWAGARHLFTR